MDTRSGRYYHANAHLNQFSGAHCDRHSDANHDSLSYGDENLHCGRSERKSNRYADRDRGSHR